MIQRMRISKFTNNKTVGKYEQVRFEAYTIGENGREETREIDARLHYFDQGKGKVLLMLHGAAQSGYTFRENFAELSKYMRVLMPDLPGHGYSDCPNMAYTVEEYAAALEAFVNAVEIDRFSIVAFGQAAGYALALAQENPERVEKLVFIHPGRFADTRFPGARAILGALGGLAIGKLAKKQHVLRLLGECYFDRTLVTEEMVKEYIRPLQQPEVRNSIRLCMANYDDGPLFGKLEQMEQKVLLISSEDDVMADRDVPEHLAAGIPDTYCLSVRNCGYLPHEEKSDQINQGLIEFLEV